MVIELFGVQFGRFEITSMIFRPKLHDTKFNYHFINSILKSQNLVSTNILLIK